jgi:hypothetical protein
MWKKMSGYSISQPWFETGIPWIQPERIFILDKLLGSDSILNGSLGTVDGGKN